MCFRASITVTAVLWLFPVLLAASDVRKSYAARLQEIGADVDIDDKGHITGLRVGGPKVEDRDLQHPQELQYLVALCMGYQDVFDQYGPGECRLTDKSLLSIGESKNLVTLSLHGHGFTDQSMPTIGRFAKLRNLGLEDTRVTDEGLKYLRGLRCESLDVTGTKITGRGLKHLDKWNSLADLVLDRTMLDNEGALYVSALKSVRELSLVGTRITDSGLKRLSALTRLLKLELNGTEVTDAGAQWFEGFKSLTTLSLVNTRITDRAIPSLMKLRKLRVLDVRETKITGDAVRELRKELPEADIIGPEEEEGNEKVDRG
jgi:hypothetical protein